MKNRLLYGSALVALMITVTLVIWQGSFDFGGYGPNGPEQTFIFWAISILIFLLMVTLAFMLVRIGVKLYIERRSNRQGSRIKTKLLIGALALSVTPIFFMVLFSVHVLNRNLDKWFSRPADQERLELIQIAKLLQDQARENAEAHAELLGSQPETLRLLTTGQKIPGRLNQFCREHNLAAAEIRGPNGQVLDAFGSRDALRSQDEDTVMVTQSIEAGGKVLGAIVLSPQIPVDVAQKRQAIKAYDRYYAQLAGSRRGVRLGYILLMALITLFVLFVATWIALFLSKQISVPIAALLEAAGEVRKGNLSYRVQVPAIDELAALVSGFNAMTRDLESNSVELDARRRFTEAILESIPTGVISVASDGRIQRVNRALKRILPEEQVARATRLEDLFSREDTAEIRYLMKRARRTGLTSRQLELRGEHRTLHLSITVSALEERLRSGFVIVLEDTSDLLRAQKAAAWNEVARRVAHEIKNPLTPISLSAERMARHLERVGLAPESARIVRECTDTIVKEVDSVKNLVDAFSQFARFPAVQPVRSDLNDVVESALTVFSGRLDGIDLRTEFAPGLAQVNIDREQFKRMVVNLVDNAAEAMQDSHVKRLLIATQPGTADTVELIVADTGCGVTAEDKEKLFLPYFSTKGRGTGLGLAIVNHILADHNAHIRVEDNVPAGARFFVEIPAIVEGVDEPRQSEPPAVMRFDCGLSRHCARCQGMKPARILVVDDEPGIRRSLCGVLEDEGYLAESVGSGEECLQDLARIPTEMIFLDVWLTGIDGMETLARIQEMAFAERPVVVMISGHANIETAVRATKLGAFDFLEKPLSLPKVIVVVKNALDHRRLALENMRLKQDDDSKYRIIGESVPMKALRQQLALMASTNGRVLIYGESGSGKELVAHAIHALSPRLTEPFVEVNCAAIPEELIESELFGHNKGSFTGAHETKTGKFQKADGGTLFLDEVGDMSLRTQAKVLRALEEQRFEPVGAASFTQVDVRVVAATNKVLEDEIERGNFREDLFYRLNVIPFHVPPLRDRREDVPLLADYFLREFTRAYGRRPKELTAPAYQLLQEYRWPGNVRELRNLIERIVIMNPQVRIDARHIPLPATRRGAAERGAERFGSLQEVRQAVEREYIIKKLEENNGNVTRTAELLGLERSNLYRKMKTLGIGPKE